MDNNDGNFAFRIDDFEGVLSRLREAGYDKATPAGDPKHSMVNRSGLAGFLQLYVMDQDRNVIEVKAAR